MALLASELVKLRVALGYNALGVAAEPYVEYHGVFDNVVTQYLQGGATTTSSTTVTASTTPAQVTLTLASATGFAQFAQAVVDVDARQERAMVQNASGSTITLLLSYAHTGTYPVTVEGGESMVRDYLKKIATVEARMANAASTAGLKRAEDIEWYPNGMGSKGIFGELQNQRMIWRDELASMLGVTNLWRLRAGSGQSVVLY